MDWLVKMQSATSALSSWTGDAPDAGDEEEGGTDLDVLDEERDLHGAAHLPPHRAHPGLVTHQAGAGVSSTAARIAHQQRGIQLREEKGIISSSVIYVDQEECAGASIEPPCSQ